MERILKNFVELLVNTFDAHSVCFFEIDNEFLKLKYYFSLSQNIKENIQLKIGESLLGWIAKNKKPVNIKGDKTDYKILEIYKKDEEIKSFIIVPVGKIGVLYLDSKRMYSITEKHQKLLNYYAKFFELLLRYMNEFKIYKERLKLLETIKKIDDENILDFLCNFYHFEWGVIIKRDGDRFFIILSNNDKIPLQIDMNESKLGLIINKGIKKISFFHESKFIFSKDDSIENIKNFIYIPFIRHGIIVSAIILFNTSLKEENILLDFKYLYKVLEIICFNKVLVREIQKDRRIQRDSDFVNQYFFFKNKSFYENKGFIVFRIKNFHKLIKKFSPDKILYSFRKFKKIVERLMNSDLEGVIFSLNTFVFVVDKETVNKSKKIIEKNLKNTYLRIENNDVNVSFSIKCFLNYKELVKYIYPSE